MVIKYEFIGISWRVVQASGANKQSSNCFQLKLNLHQSNEKNHFVNFNTDLVFDIQTISFVKFLE